MKKMLSVVLILCLVALLSALSIPAVHATPPKTAEGRWIYAPTPTSMRPAGGNMFIEATSDDEWTGTIEGKGHGVVTAVIHKTGFWYAKGLLTLEYPCKVDNQVGSLVIGWVGKGTPDGDGLQWTGQWVILSGTGGLANLHGQGIWGGPGYSGKIHFDP